MKGETQVYMPGQMIFQEGDQGLGLYFVKEGKIEVFREREGMQIQLAQLSSGDVLGTVSLVSKEPRSASARAMTESTLLFLRSDNLETMMKEIPVWAMAILKDSLIRLKQVDEKLVESRLSEKRLAARVGSPLHHGAQMASVLSGLIRLGTVTEEESTMFPIKGFVPRCESALLKKADYLEEIFQQFVTAGLIKTQETRKYGPVIVKPNAQLLDDFSVFALNVAKHGIKDFCPSKYYPWLLALVRIYKKNPDHEQWVPAELAEALGKELGRQVGTEQLGDLTHHNVLRKTTSGDKLTFGASQVQKRNIFENACRSLKDIKTQGD